MMFRMTDTATYAFDRRGDFRDRSAEHARRADGPAVGAVAAMIGVMFAGSTLLTPLYGLYRQVFGFSEITLTLLYAVYVVGNLAALFFFGRLSDQVGRRRVGVPAVLVGGVSAIVFLLLATRRGSLPAAC